MEPRTRYFHDKQLQQQTLVPQIILRTGLGDRVWGFLNPDINPAIGALASTEVEFTQSEFSEAPVLERAPRLVDLSPLQESTQPLDQDVLGSWGQGQRAVLSCEAHNDDLAMTGMVGKEYILNQPIYLFVGFPNLNWDYAQLRYSGSVNRVTLTKNKVRIEAETLC
jgi:hypothetical protein